MIFEQAAVGVITIVMWILTAIAMMLAVIALVAVTRSRDRTAGFRATIVLIIIGPFLWVGAIGALDRHAVNHRADHLKTGAAQQVEAHDAD